jgi:hypothetical protein
VSATLNSTRAPRTASHERTARPRASVTTNPP